MKGATEILLVLLCQVPTALAGQTRLGQAVEPEPILQIGEILGSSPEASASGGTVKGPGSSCGLRPCASFLRGLR